jgi:hypothetical protein
MTTSDQLYPTQKLIDSKYALWYNRDTMALEGDNVHQLYPDRNPDFLRSLDTPLTFRTAALLAVLFLLVGVGVAAFIANPLSLFLTLPVGFVVGFVTRGIWHP